MDTAKKLINKLSCMGIRSHDVYFTKQEIFFSNVYRNNITKVQNLLIDCSSKININKIDQNGLCPLHICVVKNNFELLQVLISFGAEIDQKDSKGYTSLHYASAMGNETIIKFLIRKNANLTLLSREGETVFDVAKNIDTLEYLQQKCKRKLSSTFTRSSTSSSLSNSNKNYHYNYTKEKGNRIPSSETLEDSKLFNRGNDDSQLILHANDNKTLNTSFEKIDTDLNELESKQQELKNIMNELSNIIQSNHQL